LIAATVTEVLQWVRSDGEGWTSQDWLRTGYELDTKRRNQSFDWLRFKANTT